MAQYTVFRPGMGGRTRVLTAELKIPPSKRVVIELTEEQAAQLQQEGLQVTPVA